MKENIGLVLVVIGAVTFTLSNVIGVGYALYLWAGGIAISTALWSAFVVWVKLLVSGFLLLVSGKWLKD